jgi:two-component system phosphate regulon sensor histidine kinase PhoR
MKRTILWFAAALAGFSILLTAMLIHFAVYWDYTELMKRDLAVEAGYLRAGLETAGTRYLDSLAPAGSRITLIDPDGRVLFETSARAEHMENHLSRQEVQEALLNGAGAETRFSETAGKQTYYYAVRLNSGAVLRLAKTTESVLGSLVRIMGITAVIAVFIFCLAALISSWVTSRLVSPINRLNLDAPESNLAYEELTPLLSRMKKQNDLIAAQLAQQHKTQREFAAVADNMREGLIMLDTDARVLSCNKSALTLLELKRGEIEHRSALAIRREAPFRRLIEQAVAGAAAEAVLSAGERRLRIMANPAPDAGAVLLILDETEREDREKLRREFSANVSHELKTPLMAVSGYAELMAEGIAKPEEARGFARNIYAEAQRLIALINDIIMLSRLDEQSESFPMEELDLLPLVQGVLARISAQAAERGIAVRFEGGPARLAGAPGLLEELVYNLLENAVKYNRDGGAIHVSLASTPEAGSNSRIVLSVGDTGPGIPPAEQERIFERFYRVEKSRGKNSGGTGLGLSIVKHAAALHHATVAVNSDGASGACFTVRFP